MLFTPFHLRFRYLLPAFQDSKAQGGIRRNGSKDLSQVSRGAVFVPEGETRIPGTVHRCFSVHLRFIGASEKSHLVEEGKMLCNNRMRQRERPALQRGTGSGNVGLLAGYSASTHGVFFSSTAKEPWFSSAIRTSSLPVSPNVRSSSTLPIPVAPTGKAA